MFKKNLIKSLMIRMKTSYINSTWYILENIYNVGVLIVLLYYKQYIIQTALQLW